MWIRCLTGWDWLIREQAGTNCHYYALHKLNYKFKLIKHWFL